MSDNLKKMVDMENSETRERKFKKAGLKVKIGGTMTAGGHQTFGKQNSESLTALEELLQCGICLERLSNPRMLPCQHTYCLQCLKTHVVAKNLKLGRANASDKSRNPKLTLDSEIKSMSCPICQKPVPLEDGVDSLEKLPRNLYLQSLLKVVEGAPTSPKVMENFRCVKCQMVSSKQEQVCQHCMQIFCNICWNEHLAELESNLSILIRQLKESQSKLSHKLENFASRCDLLEEKIKKATIVRVENCLKEEQQLLQNVISIKQESGVACDILLHSIETLKRDILARANDKNSSHKVITYLNLHKETSKLLDQVNYFGEARITFDPDSYKLEQISEGVYNDDDDHHSHQHHQVVVNPLESIDSMAKHYKGRTFSPKLVWTKCPRPAGMGVPPWDDGKLYIAATDSHYVLILDKMKFKMVDRLCHEEMSCPAGITFSKSRREVFVSDKWKHCIHVFSPDGDYLRMISGNLNMRSPDGIAMGPEEELIICDMANDRVLVVDSESGEKIRTIGVENGLTYLSFPTSVVVYGDKIIIADSGNNRIKIFNLNGDLLQEFGSFGKNPGQFRSAEVVAVDQLGFILVGDAGNARIQVFKPDGTLVKIFGSKSGFQWVSGILVLPNLDIITADNKTRTLKIF